MKNMPPEVREKRFRKVGDPCQTDRFKSTYEYGVKSRFLAHGICGVRASFPDIEINSRQTQGPVDSWF